MLFSTQTEYICKVFGIEEGLKILSQSGFSAVDFSMFIQETESLVYAEDYRQKALEIKSIAEKYGLVFNQAHAPFGGGYDHYTQNIIPKLPKAIEFASILGAKNIVIHPIQNGRYYGREKELFDNNVEFYRSLAPYAKKFGIKIAIENMWQHHPYTRNICDDVCAPPEELAQIYDVLNDPEAFTICLDLGHVALCGREPEDAIKVIGHDRLGCIHAHDVDYKSDMHTVPGCAKLNWDNICKALGEIDYKGDFTLEADAFYFNALKEVLPDACKYMASVAKALANRTDSYRKKS